MSKVLGRGAGLGNELIPWARSFLCAQVVEAKSLSPAFGLNKRRYDRHFGTPRYDWLAHRALAATLPVFDFAEADHQRHGAGDVVDTFRAYAEEHDLFNRRAYLVTTSGMWGGYKHVASARDFVFSTLYRSKFAARNLLKIRAKLNPDLPVVGLHVRMGDFKPETHGAGYRGQFNVALPLQWYINVAMSLQRKVRQEMQFLIASDATPEELAPLSRTLRCVVTADIPDSDCSDLLALAQTDLVVCSVSSFSAWAAFLTTAPYVWFAPNLQVHDEGFQSIWGHELLQQQTNSATENAIAAWRTGRPLVPRGHAIGEDGEVPDILIQQLLGRWRQRDPSADLVHYGVVPAGFGTEIDKEAS